MTKPEQPKPLPLPLLLVYGKPTSPELPQASWFPVEDRSTVVAAAQSLKFSVLDIRTEAEKTLIVGVHEGVLKGHSRMIVGSVTPEVFKRIEEYVAKASPASAATAPSDQSAGARAVAEQNTNTDKKDKPLSLASDPWDRLQIGSHVVGKYWESDGHPNGWWIGVITGIEKNDFIIRWPDEPTTLPLKIERKHVAILHPDFDVAREWDRRR